jgi:hypothetical protein
MNWARPSRYRRPQRGPAAAMMAATRIDRRRAGMRHADCEITPKVEARQLARNGAPLPARSVRS